jgi:O-methyltransferase involved in polyketide biosynthesis
MSKTIEPENTAVRVALWRALHVQTHVLVDDVGLQLIAPADGWQQRPDMSPFTRPFRASILARARFIEDLVESELATGLQQYVILGAGLGALADRYFADRTDGLRPPNRAEELLVAST